MKKTLSLLVALMLVLTCLPMMGATAEEEVYTYTVLTKQAGVLDDNAYMVDYWNKHYGVNFVIDNVEQGSAAELFSFGYQPLTAVYPSMAVWRKSWLDAIGEEMPKTLEDAERVWYAFAKNDPDGNGKDDTYGLSKGGMDQVYNAYGLYTDWIKGEDGQLVHRNVAPTRREALPPTPAPALSPPSSSLTKRALAASSRTARIWAATTILKPTSLPVTAKRAFTGIPAFLAGSFAEQVASAEENAFINDDGVTMPQGLLATNAAQIGATAAGAAAITAEEILALYSSLDEKGTVPNFRFGTVPSLYPVIDFSTCRRGSSTCR